MNPVNVRTSLPFANGTGFQNTTVFLTKVNNLLCPSDPDRLVSILGHNNYSGNAGSTPDSLHSKSALDGLFQYMNSAPCVAFRDITDGLSNTAAFSERIKGIGIENNLQLDNLSPSSSVWAVAQPAVTNSPQPYYTSCKAVVATNSLASLWGGISPVKPDAAGSQWFSGYATFSRYSHIMPPNSNTRSMAGVPRRGESISTRRTPGDRRRPSRRQSSVKTAPTPSGPWSARIA